MNSDIERFIKGESKNSYSYFGAHRVSDGAVFRLYAPHAKGVEVIVNDVNHKMEKIDFRGVFETRVKDTREFDSYKYEILTENNAWISKNDPYTFYNENNRSVFIDIDEYEFNDQAWLNKEKENLFFNACMIKDDFNMDDQRNFISFLREAGFNYVILRPYDEKYLYCVNKLFINESSLKRFIDNLHQVNIGVIFDFDTETFYDNGEGLNDLDGSAVYNKIDNKYKDVDLVYFDYDKNHTISYITSFIAYYMDKFHGDGLLLNNSDLNNKLSKSYEDKLIIYKSEDNKEDCVSSKYLDDVFTLVNNGFDHKKFLNLEVNDNSYLLYDYNKYLPRIKGDEVTKKEKSRILLTLTYISNCNKVSVYSSDKEYLKSLKILGDLYKNSKALFSKGSKKIIFNGKKHNYFAYEFSSRNDYVLLFINFGDEDEEKFDLGMEYYGYYRLSYNNKINDLDEKLYDTRKKKVHNKDMALQFDLKSNQALVFKRMKGI